MNCIKCGHDNFYDGNCTAWVWTPAVNQHTTCACRCEFPTEVEEEDESASPTIYRTLITAECFPKPEADGTAWVRQQTVLAHQLLELLSSMHAFIQAESPVLLDPNRSMVGLLLATVGSVVQNLESAGFAWMATHQVEPLNLHTERVRIARAQIEADPDMPDNIRADLEALIASPDSEADGAFESEIDDTPLFMPGDSEQVH